MGWLRSVRAGIVRLEARVVAPNQLDRGDVPGWVMITLMTAVIVVLIWGIASSSLQDLLKSAFAKVSDQAGS